MGADIMAGGGETVHLLAAGCWRGSLTSAFHPTRVKTSFTTITVHGGSLDSKVPRLTLASASSLGLPGSAVTCVCMC